MDKTTSSLCFLVVLFVLVVDAKKLPDYVGVCRRNQPESDKCFVEEIKKLLPRLVGGIPALGVLPVDPLRIPELMVDSGNTGSFSFYIQCKNAEFRGARNTDVKLAKIDLDNNRFVFDLQIPYLNQTCEYKSKGKVLVVPIDGEGQLKINYENVSAQGIYDGSRITKKGEEFLKFDKHHFNITIGGGNGHFENLIKGNPELSEATNKVFNENFNLAFEEFKPSLSLILGEVSLQAVNSVHDRFPIDVLYPV